MIAHRIERKAQAASSSARLVQYILASQGGSDPSTWKRTADYLLDTRSEGAGEKVASYRVSHCGTQDPADATLQILATQAANTRSKADKTYHLVYAFPPGEHPETSVLHAIEDTLCQAIGLAEHQRISAVHVDRDHLHVHVAINKVHPSGLQNIEPYYDKRRLMEACVQLEQQYGLQPTPHGLRSAAQHQVKAPSDPVTPISPKAAKMQAYSGLESFNSHLVRRLAPALRQAQTWQAVHRQAARQGCVVRVRGAGLVVGDPQANLWLKASRLGRDLSYKALTDRLGPFQSPQVQQPSQQPQGATGSADPAGGSPYTSRPTQQVPASAALFARYQQERQAALRIRHQAQQQLYHQDSVFKAQMKQWRQRQRMLLKVVLPRYSRRLISSLVAQQARSAAQYHRQQSAAQRKTLYQRAPLPTWMDWLCQQAEQGNPEALALLQARAVRTVCWKADRLKPEAAVQAKAVLLKSLQPQVGRDGRITYHTRDGGQVIDRQTEILMSRSSSGAALVALELAAQHFTGQRLEVEGSDAFKQELARLAGLHGLRVQFMDPVMEQKRQAIVQQKTHSAIEHWIVERNQTQQTHTYRHWQPSDQGRVHYQGQQRMREGSDCLLLRRGHEVLVKPVSPETAAQAKTWPLGKVLSLDGQGRLGSQVRSREH